MARTSIPGVAAWLLVAADTALSEGVKAMSVE
jgi:hypothetical protein